MRPAQDVATSTRGRGSFPFAGEPARGALSPYLEAVRAHPLLVGLVIVATTIAAVTWHEVSPSKYEATADIFVTPLPAEAVAAVGLPLIQDLRDPTRTIQTAASLVESHAAAARTALLLGTPWTRRDIQRAVDVHPKGQTNILEVRATAESAELAARIANTFATASLAIRRTTVQRLARAAIPDVRSRLRLLPPGGAGVADLQGTLNRLQSLARGPDPTLSIAQLATPPSSSLGAPGWLIAALGVLAGVMLGVAAAVVIEKVRPARITSEDELVSLFPLPVLARLPTLRRRLRRGYPLDIEPGTREALRTVQVQLDLSGKRTRTVMITSPSPDDGKTTTALSFGVALADAGKRVILIDTDVRGLPTRISLDPPASVPVAARALTYSNTPQEPAPTGLRPLLRRVEGHGNLQLLDAVDIGFDSVDEHSRDRFRDLVRTAAKEADYVIVDTPPLGLVSDALTLLELVDDVLIVAKIRSTTRAHVEVTRDLLARAGVEPVGFIVVGEGPIGTYPYFMGQASSR